MKRIKKLSATALILVLLLASTLSGCGKSKVSFVWYTDAAFKTVDPQLAASAAELTAVKHLFSGLYRLDESGTPQPDQAISTRLSEDGLVYTFTLAKDAVYTDAKGKTTPLTAHDYVFGLRRAVNPDTHSPSALDFFVIEGAREIYENNAADSSLGVRAVDDYTLEIRLSTADSGFLAKLSSSAAMPCNEAFFESTGGTYGLTKASILGNGPFVLTGFSSNSGLTLSARDDAIQSAVSRIRLIPDDGEADAAELLADGKQDFAVAYTAEEEALLTGAKLPGQSFETGCAALLFNCKNEALSHVGVRTALADWAVESAGVYGAEIPFSPATGLVPGAVMLNGASYRESAGDVRVRYSAAQRYATYQLGLSELGVSKLSGIRVVIPDTEPYISLYRTINQNWQRELGAFFAVEQLSPDLLAARIEQGDYDIALISLSPDENTPAALLKPFISISDKNVTGYSSAAFDSLMEKALFSNTSNQLPAWKNAEQLLLTDAPVVPLVFTRQSIFTSAGLSGVVIDPFGPVLDLTGARFS